ncbi:MAG: tRNA (cytidine(34)-2'-O)-methyltransferase [Deltaproteobacteria bacterium]|nr:tRNA (cytidine(34)-2'-O)-methyltransferase [Deltaproteobacteria bacterium]
MDLNIVLVEPEIPQNTGSIGRLCLATQCTLHLIEPLGFEITDAQLKRAGLDYWKHLKVLSYQNLNQFFETTPKNAPMIFLSKKAKKNFYEHRFLPGSFLFFGKETKGLPGWLLEKYKDQTYKIPIFDPRVRSLNLANAVGIVVYEAIRQHMIR